MSYDRLYGQIAALTERAEHAEARAEKAEAALASANQMFEVERAMIRNIAKGADERIQKAETALDEAIARADKASNALIRTTAALRETIIRAEKAEARVAELERDMPEICRDCGVAGAIYDEKDSSGVVRNHVCGRCGSAWQASPLVIPPVETPIRDRIPPKPARVEAWKVVGCDMFSYERYDLDTYPTKAEADAVASLRNRNAPKDQPGGMHDRYSVKKVWVDAKTAPKTPVPAPEGTETVQKAPPPSPVGAPRSDQGSDSAGQIGSPGPVLGHPRGFGSTDTLVFGRSPAERPVYGSCRGCKGLTPDPEIPFCAMCCDLGRGGASKKDLDQMREVIARRATTCEDVKCPCVTLSEEHGPVTLTDEDRVDLTKPQTLRAWATFGEASPGNSIRITVDPAAAAEVEARTGAYGRGLTKTEAAAYEGVLHGFMRDAMKGLDESMIGAIHEDGPCVLATLKDHPRAGLPSRDEVAAFLEARWPR